MSAIAKNNAFGAGSPSWNQSFPEGNLTAAEIIAYLPHWLKSVDVILRLANHGGRSVVITHVLTKLRVLPTHNYKSNSTTVMMHYAMRRAGNEQWTIGTRGKYEYDREYDESSLYVGDFRPPRITHPKIASNRQTAQKDELARNAPAEPIPFKDLARHVKEHPSGDDALDLARCVQYAVKNPKEKWYFPTDFQKLVKHLGGPHPVSHSHLDRQFFARYNHVATTHGPRRALAKYDKKRKVKADSDVEPGIDTEIDNNDTEIDDNDTEIDDYAETDDDTLKTKSKTELQPGKVHKKGRARSKKVMRQARDSVLADTAMSATAKRANAGNGGGKRRSSRRVKQAPVYVDENEDATDLDADSATLYKKRKLLRMPPPPKEDESDFEAREEVESDDEMLHNFDEDAEISDVGTPYAARGQRRAAHKARQYMHDQCSAISMEQFRVAAAKPADNSFMNHSSEAMEAARAHECRTPTYLPAPILSANRLIVDSYTLHLYAQEGCRNEEEMWASALSTYRFGEARRHAPFRELYRLTEPMVWDTSDWAENIRWAKEQYRVFGAETWTEYDDHLERITKWRMQTFWVSEEVITAGM